MRVWLECQTPVILEMIIGKVAAIHLVESEFRSTESPCFMGFGRGQRLPPTLSIQWATAEIVFLHGQLATADSFNCAGDNTSPRRPC